MINLTTGQKKAIIKAIKWYFDPDKRIDFYLCGSAGTGKSTVAKTLVQVLGLSTYQVIMVTYTGKAASVLRSKGNIANTIHSMFYRVYQSPGGKVSFVKKKSIPDTIKLILIDEVSMVNEKMMNDLRSFGIPLLCLGDPGQLPALYYPNLGVQNPDVFLEEVMRQKGDSGIIQLATMARKDIPIKYGTYNESKVIKMKDLHNIEEYDVVLVWSNRARKELNALIRSKLGLTSKYPIKGEKLVCLKNNYNYEIDYGGDMIINPVNGLGITALSDSDVPEGKKEYFTIKCKPDFIKGQEDKFFTIPVSKIPFDAYETMREYESDMMNIEEVVLDFGYCLTCHKSQGSSWPNVLVIDDFKGARKDYKNWLYTALTRAETSVTLVR